MIILSVTLINVQCPIVLQQLLYFLYENKYIFDVFLTLN